VRAILLAAGYGRRLRPLTNRLPKCLMPIKGKPLLEIWLDRLTQAGIGPFLVNTHYKAEQVEAFIKGGPYRDSVRLIHEPSLQGTAGTLRENLDFFGGEDGLLIHADNYCLADMVAFARAHESRPRCCLITMMTFCTEDPSSCGIVEVDERGIVTGFHEKVASPPGNLANGAIYLLSQAFMSNAELFLENATDFSTEVLPRLLGRIYTYHTAAPFIDIGTPENYARANAL